MQSGGEARGPVVEINPRGRDREEAALSLLDRLELGRGQGDVGDAVYRGGAVLPPATMRRNPLMLAYGGEVSPTTGGIGYVSQAQQDPAWQAVQLSAPSVDISKLKNSAQNQGISPSTIQSVMALLNQSGAYGKGGGLTGAQAGYYGAAGSSTPVYGESGYPSAIPVSGYATGGGVGYADAPPQYGHWSGGRFYDAGTLTPGQPYTPSNYNPGDQGGGSFPPTPSVEISAGDPVPLSQELNPISLTGGQNQFTSGADMYRQMITDYLAQNPNDAAASATAAALEKNIPTGTGWRARQFYGIGPVGSGNVPAGQAVGSGNFQGESGPTSFGTNTSGLFSGLEPGGSLGGGLASGGSGGMLPGGFTSGIGGGGGGKPTVRYL
jgi:hypothetical protein